MKKQITWILFVVYLIILIYMMFFGFGRSVRPNTAYNIIPFKTIYLYFLHAHHFKISIWFINMVGNIGVFIPFGLLLPGLSHRLKKTIPFLTVFFIGITILETFQYTFKVGSFDVDDILLNSLGAWIGLKIWLFMSTNKKI